MPQEYPIVETTTLPGSGVEFLEYVLSHARVPARTTHNNWFAERVKELERPDMYALRGDKPKEGSILILRSIDDGEPIVKDINLPSDAGITQMDNNIVKVQFGKNPIPAAIHVNDIADSTIKTELALPPHIDGKDKVYNPNMVKYEELPVDTLVSNISAAESVPGAIDFYFTFIKPPKNSVFYTEKDVTKYLDTCIDNMSSPEIALGMFLNHWQWRSAEWKRKYNNKSDTDPNPEDTRLPGDLARRFWGSNSTDFYKKDYETLIPTVLYSMALLGKDPVSCLPKLARAKFWDIDKTAHAMRKYMHEEIRPTY